MKHNVILLNSDTEKITDNPITEKEADEHIFFNHFILSFCFFMRNLLLDDSEECMMISFFFSLYVVTCLTKEV